MRGLRLGRQSSLRLPDREDLGSNVRRHQRSLLVIDHPIAHREGPGAGSPDSGWPAKTVDGPVIYSPNGQDRFGRKGNLCECSDTIHRKAQGIFQDITDNLGPIRKKSRQKSTNFNTYIP
jgi:hypothetical protein